MGKFLHHFQKICNIKYFQMKKFERSHDSILHPYIGCWWLLTGTKIINQQNLIIVFFATFRVLSLPEKILLTFFLVENQIFCKF